VKMQNDGCECVQGFKDTTPPSQCSDSHACDGLGCPQGFEPTIDDQCQCTCNILTPTNLSKFSHAANAADDTPKGIEEHLKNTLAADQPILYAVSTGSVYHNTRAKAVWNTWCKKIQMCVVYSDAVNPANNPPVIPISMTGLENTLTGVHLAQLRYLRIYRHASRMVLDNRYKLFGKTKWLVITDDDTYVFHINMLAYLSSLDAKKATYTGHTIKDQYYPITGDGDGHTLNVSISQHFACGGGGSVFSHAALGAMANYIDGCVDDSMPGGLWWGYQSDWMFGLCTSRAGVSLLNQPSDRFGQFLYNPTSLKEVLTDDPGPKQFCAPHHGWCAEPVSLHPIHDPQGMYDLHKTLPSSESEVKQAQIILQEDGHVTVKHGNGEDGGR